MSDTPRTDAAREAYANWHAYAKLYGHIPEAMEQAPPEADPFWIAEQLERELAVEPTPAVFRSNRNPMHLTDAEFLNDFEEKPNGHP